MTTVSPFLFALFVLAYTNNFAATTHQTANRINEEAKHTLSVPADLLRCTSLPFLSSFICASLFPQSLYGKASSTTAYSNARKQTCTMIYGSVVGTVVDSIGVPIAGVMLYLGGTEQGVSSKPDGCFYLPNVTTNSYTLHIAAAGYQEITTAVYVAPCTATTLHIQLCSTPKHRSSTANDSLYGRLIGTVYNAKGQPIVGATVLVEGTKRGAYTKPNGRFTIVKLLPGTHTVRVKSIGFQDAMTTATISAGSTESCQILLHQDNKGNSCTLMVCNPRMMVDPTVIGTIRTISAEELQRAPQVPLPQQSDTTLFDEKQLALFVDFSTIVARKCFVIKIPPLLIFSHQSYTTVQEPPEFQQWASKDYNSQPADAPNSGVFFVAISFSLFFCFGIHSVQYGQNKINTRDCRAATWHYIGKRVFCYSSSSPATFCRCNDSNTNFKLDQRVVTGSYYWKNTIHGDLLIQFSCVLSC